MLAAPSWSLPRGDLALLAALDAAATIQIECESGADGQCLAMAQGRRLLLASVDHSLHVYACVERLELDKTALIRLLAFHDHGIGLERAPPRRDLTAAWMQVTEKLEQPATAHAWVLHQLLQPDATFACMAACLARTESYRLVRFILAQPEECKVQQLADRYGLSATQFRRLCRHAFGRPLKQQLRLLRAGRALMAYAYTGQNFTTLAAELGYASPSHFCIDIKALTGLAPRAIYRLVKHQHG